MAATLVLVCFLSLMCCTLISDALMLSELLSLNVDSNGQEVCVTGKPFNEYIVLGKFQCALDCVLQKGCIHFNYLKSNSMCQIFYGFQKTMERSDGCKSYKNTVNRIELFFNFVHSVT